MKNFLYNQVYESIKKHIIDSELLPGSKLHTEEEYTQKYEVSAITIKKALELLVNEGYVYRVPGKGTFVSSHHHTNLNNSNESEVKSQTYSSTNNQKGTQSITNISTNSKEGLSTQRNNNKYIGLVLEHASSPFGLDMMFYIDQIAQKAGYKLCIRFSYGDREKEVEEIKFLCSLGVSGIIIMPCHGNHYNKSILKLVLENFPIVLIDKKMTGIPVPSVRSASVSGVKTLVEHLYERGCRRIGLITLDVNGTTSLVERRKGFYSGINQLELEVLEECVLPHDTDFLDSAPAVEHIEGIRSYLDRMKGELDGIVCTEFGIISALVQGAKEANVKIGEDFKVCCIDEDYLAPRGYTFTHMKQDEKEIAKESIRIITSLISGERIESEDFEIQTKFLKGETT